MLRLLSLLAALYVFWILMSGFFTPFLLAAGFGASLAVLWIAHRMEVIDPEGHPAHLTPGALGYWAWLLREIAKSALQVTRIILDPKLPISPALARFRPRQETTVGLATHANSITLTPGTVTIEAAPEEFLVHSITREGAASTIDSEMDRRVREFEGSP
jgi:multicomponent Na+:H+ antiporter subunit E